MRSSRRAASAQAGLIPSSHEPEHRPEGEHLASRSELSAFLAGVERRAFKQAVFAVRDEEAALDIVQDAMLRLAEKLRRPPAGGAAAAVPAHPAERDPRLVPAPEGALAVDHPAFLASRPAREDDDQDPLETLQAAGESNREEAPPEQLEQSTSY